MVGGEEGKEGEFVGEDGEAGGELGAQHLELLVDGEKDGGG